MEDVWGALVWTLPPAEFDHYFVDSKISFVTSDYTLSGTPIYSISGLGPTAPRLLALNKEKARNQMRRMCIDFGLFLLASSACKHEQHILHVILTRYIPFSIRIRLDIVKVSDSFMEGIVATSQSKLTRYWLDGRYRKIKSEKKTFHILFSYFHYLLIKVIY